MKNSLDVTFMQVYKPLLEKFVKDLENLNTDTLPLPFLPYFGTEYENSTCKIAIVGWETRDNIGLTKYIDAYNNNSDEVYYWFRDDLDKPFYFLDKGYRYTNNTGKDFWGFTLQFLAKFYSKNDWKELKVLYPEILQSFLWGNVCSIERYDAANRKGTKSEEYNKVKLASKIFDRFDLVLNTFKPNIVLLLNWTAPEEWIINGFTNHSGPDKIDEDFLWHYYIEDTDTHIYKTPHPRYLALNKINFEHFIFKIMQDIKSRKIFEDFPGDKLLAKYNKRTVLLNKLKMQIQEAANNFGIKIADEEWGNGGESYFNFKLPNSKNEIIICFGFDKGFEKFTVGVEMKENGVNYLLLKQEISSKLSPVIGKDANYPNWAYLHYYDDDLKNWDIQNKIWDGIDDYNTCNRLMKIIEETVTALKEIQL